MNTRPARTTQQRPIAALGALDVPENDPGAGEGHDQRRFSHLIRADPGRAGT